MQNIINALLISFAAFVFLVFLGLLISFPVMLLWNLCLVPAIPGVLEIGWLQAWGLMILCSFMFKPIHTTPVNN